MFLYKTRGQRITAQKNSISWNLGENLSQVNIKDVGKHREKTAVHLAEPYWWAEPGPAKAAVISSTTAWKVLGKSIIFYTIRPHKEKWTLFLSL